MVAPGGAGMRGGRVEGARDPAGRGQRAARTGRGGKGGRIFAFPTVEGRGFAIFDKVKR
jgi:hypothetical protein